MTATAERWILSTMSTYVPVVTETSYDAECAAQLLQLVRIRPLDRSLDNLSADTGLAVNSNVVVGA